jgi:hypothetical protein
MHGGSKRHAGGNTMKNLIAKLQGIKSTAVRALAGIALAGAVLAAAPAAQAQRVVVGFGGPRVYVAAPPVRFYGRPAYGPEFYGYRHDDWRFRHDHDYRYYHRDWR